MPDNSLLGMSLKDVIHDINCEFRKDIMTFIVDLGSISYESVSELFRILSRSGIRNVTIRSSYL